MALDRQQLDRLRSWRLGTDKDLGLGTQLAGLIRDVKRQTTQLGGLGDAWSTLCPPELAASTALLSLTRGILAVRVTDAAQRFAVDRWLRSGGETELIKRCPTLLRVRLLV